MDSAWTLVLFAGLYLPTHLTLYFIACRNQPAFRTERGILLFHLVSACALTLGAGSWAFLANPFSTSLLAAGVAAIFAHGIYSLTFLELWTLSQISFSQEVLDRATSSGISRTALDELAAIGDRKRVERIAGLHKSGLIVLRKGKWALTGRGRIVASGLAAVQALPSVQSPG